MKFHLLLSPPKHWPSSNYLQESPGEILLICSLCEVGKAIPCFDKAGGGTERGRWGTAQSLHVEAEEQWRYLTELLAGSVGPRTQMPGSTAYGAACQMPGCMCILQTAEPRENVLPGHKAKVPRHTTRQKADIGTLTALTKPWALDATNTQEGCAMGLGIVWLQCASLHRHFS